MNLLTLGIVGATGMVGQTAIDILWDIECGDIPFCSEYKIETIKLFASKSSAGKRINYGKNSLVVSETTLAGLLECDAVLFAAEAAISTQFIPQLAAAGILCIDKSSAYRESADVPLVVPEVNAHCLSPQKLLQFPVVANPNCCSTPLTVALKPLLDAFGLQRVVVDTYQSVSGAGKGGMDALSEESKNFFTREDLNPDGSAIFPKPIAFNVMPFVAKILENGDTDEESKIKFETKKILDLPKLLIAATSVRVPTYVGHAEAVTLQLSKPASLAAVRACLAGAPGVIFVDEFLASSPEAEDDVDVTHFATPRDVQGKNAVYVSRVRTAEIFENGFALWIVADNLRKGAALNAIQILSECCANGLITALRTRRKELS